MIIAVACSINHAERIVTLYKKSGLSTSVIHSGLEKEEREAVISDIKNNRIDVVVNVGMLGEGFDHKFLSVAAIFRPFRNQLPYAQFIGRILRYIKEGITAEDNIGRVVSHKFLYLEELWKSYKIEIEESDVIRNLLEQNDIIENSYGSEDSDPRITDVGAVSSSTGILTQDAYLETELLRRHREEASETERKIRIVAETLGLSIAKAEKIVENENVDKRYLRPDLFKQFKRKDIDSKIRENIVPSLYVKYIQPRSEMRFVECPLLSGRKYAWIKTSGANDQGKLAMYFNSYLQAYIGKKRDEWSLDDYDRANDVLEKHAEYVEGILSAYYE